MLPQSCIRVKVAFLQKNQLGIGVKWGKPGEVDKNWILEPFYSKIQRKMDLSFNFGLILTGHPIAQLVARLANFL